MISYAVTFIIVMVAVCIADVCWTMYFIETENRNAVKAGFWSASIMIVGAFTTTQYINDKSLIVAAAIGAFIGTAGIIKWKSSRKQ